MRAVPDHLWWKPFSTYLNCVQGQCIESIDKEECERQCSSDPFCQLGYHIRYPDSREYCVLNRTSYQWANDTPLISLIRSSNPTLFSTDKGIEYNGFYNENRFPSFQDLPNDFFSYIFSGMRVLFSTTTDPPLFLTKELTFSLRREDSILLRVVEQHAFFYDFSIRIGFGHTITLIEDETFFQLSFSNNQFTWERKYGISLSTSFDFVFRQPHERFQFVNDKTPFALSLNKSQDQFLSIKDNHLILQSTPETLFCFQIDHFDKYNNYRFNQMKNGENIDKLNVPIFQTSFDNYLSLHYPCYPPFPKNHKFINELLVLLIILIISMLLYTRSK